MVLRVRVIGLWNCRMAHVQLVCRLENPPEAGILPEAVVKTLDSDYQDAHAERRSSATAASTSSSGSSAFAANSSGVLYPPSERGHIRDSWKHLMRWSRAWRTAGENGTSVMGRLEKVCVGQLEGLPCNKLIQTWTLSLHACAGCRLWWGILWNRHGLRFGAPKVGAECDSPFERPLCLQGDK